MHFKLELAILAGLPKDKEKAEKFESTSQDSQAIRTQVAGVRTRFYEKVVELLQIDEDQKASYLIYVSAWFNEILRTILSPKS